MIELEKLCLQCMGCLNQPDGNCQHCGANLAEIVNAANQLECGSILAGTYLIGCTLGQGGFGITYIGLDLNLNLKVAIKEYYPEGYVTREGQTHSTVLPLPGERRILFERGKEKFVSEAQILAKFSEDPSIVGVRGFFQENGTAYIVMNFVEGETLKEYARKCGGKLPAAEVLAMMGPLFKSLSKVHAAGLIHRDISPDNIMRRKDGTIVLLDFGAARQMSIDGEHSNTINVKHGFAPEEQYRTHGEQGPWTDVYALCATIYRLTTGVTPQQALDRAMNNILLLPPNKLGADFSIQEQQAILHGLAVRADQRTTSIEQLQQELEGEVGIPSDQRNDQQEAIVRELNLKHKSQRKIADFKSTGKLAAIVGVGAIIIILTIAILSNLNKKGSDNKAEIVVANTAVPTNEVVIENSPAEQVTLAPTATPRIFAPLGTVLEGRLAVGSDYSLVLLDDGTVRCYGGKTSGVYEDVQTWSNIIYISGDYNHAVGLRKNGTLVPAGINKHGELDVRDLEHVTQVITGYLHTVALTEDGKVYYFGYNKHGRANCEEWTNVKKLLGGDDHLAAILNDGTMIATGYNGNKQCDLYSINDAIGGAVASGTTFVLHSNQTVEDFGKNWVGEDDVFDWNDIIYVDGAAEHTVGLQSNGKVLIAGSNENYQYEVKAWENIVAICAGQYHTIGIDMYGFIHITGPNGAEYCSGDGDSIWQ